MAAEERGGTCVDLLAREGKVGVEFWGQEVDYLKDQLRGEGQEGTWCGHCVEREGGVGGRHDVVDVVANSMSMSMSMLTSMPTFMSTCTLYIIPASEGAINPAV
jgi:hypothetical protein